MLYLPNQVIANKGDIGHNMYFIHKGLVEVNKQLHFLLIIIIVITASFLQYAVYH